MTLEQILKNSPEDYKALQVIKTRHHPVCTKILQILEGEPKSVQTIEAALQAAMLDYCIEQSTVSLYLSKLRELELVVFQQVGKQRFYSLPKKAVAPTPSVRKPRERLRDTFNHPNHHVLSNSLDSLMTHLR